MTCQELAEKLRAFDVKKEVIALYERHGQLFVDANRESLWDGKDREGNSIRPSYLEDPFFKTQNQAEGYAKWKQKITPNAARNKYDPNLFINGYTYSKMTFIPGENPLIGTEDAFAAAIVNKYPLAFGVEQKAEPIFEKVLNPEFFEILEQKTGLSVN